jgi:hypothetical protein
MKLVRNQLSVHEGYVSIIQWCHSDFVRQECGESPDNEGFNLFDKGIVLWVDLEKHEPIPVIWKSPSPFLTREPSLFAFPT